MNDYEFFEKQEKAREKAEIRRYGILGGLCVLGFLLIQEILFLVLTALGGTELYSSDELFSQSVELLFTVLSICVPFLICGVYEKKYTSYSILPMEKPKDTVLSVLAVPAGVALCFIASTLTSYLTYFLEFLGLKLSSPNISAPSSGFEIVIYFLRLTLVAAVIEEISFRGVIMQPLRKYGDGFAIAMAAVIFGLVHCNLIQAPFAILAGAVIGYFTIVTQSLWTGIIIHLLNNAVSGVLSFVSSNYSEQALLTWANAVYSVIMFLGIICLILFFMRRRTLSTHGKRTFLTTGEKLKAYILNPAMIIAFLAICWYTHFYISI